jgi:uncharacterized protein
MESPIQFTNHKGDILRGILHTPVSRNIRGTKDILIFPNGGVMGAEGDYRAYISMARQIASKGYYVLRFSPSGLGYSDGTIPDCRQRNLYYQIEKGLFVEDIKAAVKFIRTIEEFSSITLSGVCGGAISALLAAAELKEVGYVIPIGIPVILDSDDADYSQRIASLDKSYLLKYYFNKIINIRSWLNYITGKSDVRTIHATILALFQKKTKYIGNKDDKSKFMPNPLFFKSVEKIIEDKKKMLFVFGDTDGFLTEFNNLFLERLYCRSDERPFDIFISHRSNHMLSLREMQADVTEEMLRWMQEQEKN